MTYQAKIIGLWGNCTPVCLYYKCENQGKGYCDRQKYLYIFILKIGKLWIFKGHCCPKDLEW